MTQISFTLPKAGSVLVRIPILYTELCQTEWIHERLLPCRVASESQSGTSFPESGTSFGDFIMRMFRKYSASGTSPHET
jgi:hypothetical protein